MTAERLTVPTLLARHRHERPTHRFLVTDDQSLTYAELDDETLTLAAALIELGIKRGTRVGLLAANGIEWALTAFAVMRIGATVVPLSTLLTPRELAANLRAAGVAHLIAAERTRSRDHLADLREIDPGLTPMVATYCAPLPRLQSVSLLRSFRRPPDASSLALAAELGARVTPADDMAIMFTSGSRGAPKAVLHTHGGALGATAASLGPRVIGPEQRMYIPMPFFWMGGFGGGLVTVFVAGATLVTEAEPNPETTLRLLERERVTLFRGWPDQAAALASHPARATADLSSIGPGSLDPLLPVELQAGPGQRPVLFGMTETFGPYCCDPLDGLLPTGKTGALGRPFAGVEVCIADPDTKVALAAGETGEILVRGPNLMRGICGREREETFTPDGYYPTGDAGRLDADGYLWFTGRLDDMFKVAGASVYPSEVEEALASLDYVDRAFAVDITHEGVLRVGAAVVPKGDCTAAQLATDAKRLLSAFKVPARFRIAALAEIPRGTTGKVDKDALRAFIEGTS